MAQEASGKGRKWMWEQLGALIHCLLTGLRRAGSHHLGKSSVGALVSAGAAKRRGLCTATISASKKKPEGESSRAYAVL